MAYEDKSRPLLAGGPFPILHSTRISAPATPSGDAEPEHTHPPMVGYFVEGATALVIEDDGSSAEVTLPSGAFVENLEWWRHSLRNIGDTPLHSILVEFKHDAGGS